MELAREEQAPTPGPVVVAYDGSIAARRALLHAAALAGHGGRATVVNVIPVQSVSARLETVSDEEYADHQRVLREARVVLARRGVDVRTVALAGDPVAEILAVAEESGARVLLVGRGGRRVKHPLRGSVGMRLLRAAHCDVLAVR